MMELNIKKIEQKSCMIEPVDVFSMLIFRLLFVLWKMQKPAQFFEESLLRLGFISKLILTS